jgi:hypothetical protein
MLLVGCGESEKPSAVETAGTSAGGVATGGSQPNLIGGSGGARAGAASGGSFGSAGELSGGGSGVVWPEQGFGPVPAGTACDAAWSVMDGNVEGQAFSNGYRYRTPWLTTFSSWWYSWLSLHAKTWLFTKARQLGDSFDPQDDLAPAQPYALGGWLALDTEGPDPSAVYCLNTGSTLTAGEKAEDGQPLDFQLTLSKLGSCPGTPVSGSLSFCYGPMSDASCPDGVVGELEGTPIMTTLQGGARNSDLLMTEDVASFMFGERWIRMRFPIAGGPLETGLLLDAAGSTFELTTAYCLDTATATPIGTSSYRIEVSSISKLGDCSEGASVGTAHVCAWSD